MSERAKSGLAMVIVALAVFYMFANKTQVSHTIESFQAIAHGEPAPELTFLLDDKVVLTHRTHSTGIFDAAGEHQVSFFPVEPRVFARLKEDSEGIDVRLDNERLPDSSLKDHGDILQVTWDDRKLSIVRDNDVRSIAANILFYKKNRRDIIQCFGGEFCSMIRVDGDWGDLTGPFAPTDLMQLRRGLPRGRWGSGPTNRINIQSQVASEVWIAVSFLKLFPDQKLAFGGAVQETRPYRADTYKKAYGGLDLHPGARLLRVALKPGDNPIDIRYSKWAPRSPRVPQKLAAYITGFKIKPVETLDEEQ